MCVKAAKLNMPCHTQILSNCSHCRNCTHTYNAALNGIVSFFIQAPYLCLLDCLKYISFCNKCLVVKTFYIVVIASENSLHITLLRLNFYLKIWCLLHHVFVNRSVAMLCSRFIYIITTVVCFNN